MINPNLTIINKAKNVHFCSANTILFEFKDHTTPKTQMIFKKMCLDIMEIKQDVFDLVWTQGVNNKEKIVSEILNRRYESLSIDHIKQLTQRCLDYIRRYGIVKYKAYASQLSMYLSNEHIYLYKTYFTIQTTQGPARVMLPEEETASIITDYLENLLNITITCETDMFVMTLKRKSSSNKTHKTNDSED